ncbi:hypothetical protein G6F57_018703 [Rhizopus arrhizus]|nr:hypothetical protein G6F57_018703 [Rhizopus arrhizus]
MQVGEVMTVEWGGNRPCLFTIATEADSPALRQAYDPTLKHENQVHFLSCPALIGHAVYRATRDRRSFTGSHPRRIQWPGQVRQLEHQQPERTVAVPGASLDRKRARREDQLASGGGAAYPAP